MSARRWIHKGVALFLPLLLLGCGSKPIPAAPAEQPAPTSTAQTSNGEPWEKILEQMTLREKVGQLFMVRPDALDPGLTQAEIDDETAHGVTDLTDAMRRTLEQYPVGGICQFGKNLVNPEQITRFNADLQAASDLPMLIAVDEEGGRVARLANHPAFDLPQYGSAAAVGATGNPEEATKMGETIGGYLRAYGFTMDFAPVADVWTNPANTVIGDRAFSQDAGIVAKMACAMAEGLAEEHILPVFKHFPGHGDTAQDSHDGLAYTQRTAEEMTACEWLPYQLTAQENTANGAYAVMVGHICAPVLDEENIPASLSYTLVTEQLRQRLLADKPVLVVTDSLSMGAITQLYTPGEASVQALLAGCDVLLMPNSLPEAFEAVMDAVEQGIISEERLDESVMRILRYKQQYAGLEAAAEQ